MKKILSFVLSAVMLCATLLPAAAVPNGTVVNHTLYTDIVAMIDDHPIRSYNVDNRTVIVAEDLRAYGFYAIWHAGERWLEVVRPVENGEPLTPASYPAYVPALPAGMKVGMPAHDILATDIVTTVAGDTVESWNINGETCILFRDLERYGEVGFDAETRTALFTTEPYKVFAGGHAVEQAVPEGWQTGSRMTADGMSVTFRVGGDADSWSGFLGADKSDVNMDMIWDVQTAPAAKVSVAFYPAQFEGQSLRQDLYTAISALPIPSATETIDFTNTPEVRAAVAEIFRVTLNGAAVTGDLFRTQGSGHSDFVFLFDQGFEVKPGDEIAVVIGKGA